MRKKLLSLLFVMLLVIGICFVPDVDAGTSVLNITNETYSIDAGQSFTLKLNGIKAKKVKWSSSNKSVATVSKKGVVKGIKKGKTTIIGKYKGLKFKINVNVFNASDNMYSADKANFKYKESKVTEIDGHNYFVITFTFTNDNSKGMCFLDFYEEEAYKNDVKYENDDFEGVLTKIKNGKSIDVSYMYKAKSKDKIEFLLYEDDPDDDAKPVFSIIKTIE